MFGIPIGIKWYVTTERKGVIYYLSAADDDARQLTWSQQQTKALKFETTKDAEIVMNAIVALRKNKNLKFKVR